MRLINFFSVIGLIVASYFSYVQFYMGGQSASYYPVSTGIILPAIFAVSYLVSLFDSKVVFLRVTALFFVFLGVILTCLYSILIVLSKADFPYMFKIPGAYIELCVFFLLMIMWNKQR